jgi:S1-C subfamily serine protease
MTRRARAPIAILALALVLAPPMAIGRTAAAATVAGDVVACYDVKRNLVTHVLPSLCDGEVISPEREAALDAERRQRIQATILKRTSLDPITGSHRLIGTGSGFFVGSDGALLTNSHVVNHCELLTATPDDGSKIPARIVAASPQPDLALLRTDRPAPGVASFSAAPERSDGAHLAVVGYPAYGLPTRLSTLSPAQIEPLKLATQAGGIRFNGEIRHGNSGSPLLDQSGNVLGVVYATVDTPKMYAATHKLVTDVGVAVSYRAALQFLTENDVHPQMASESLAPLSRDELHNKSRGFVVQIGCWK